MKTVFRNSLSKIISFLFRAFLRPVYAVYEWKLYREVKRNPMPRHVAIIPDGNRRWASKKGFGKIIGHYYGYNKMKEVLKWLYDLNIKVVTVYAMSYENCLYRSDYERENLFNIISQGLRELSQNIDKYKVRVRVLGRLEHVPKEVVRLAQEIEDKSKSYDERFLNILLCYGGRQEIVDAFNKLYKDLSSGKLSLKEINEEIISKYMYTGFMGDLQEPDLVIRTSGEIRISNFLLWQTAYSELYFCEALWPEFRKIDLLRAIRSYQHRERRFGR
jgi:tritrans,polycis-undecaprenyl-diphosphate synthase [geranylgeranyl-diphosphate specific]